MTYDSVYHVRSRMLYILDSAAHKNEEPAIANITAEISRASISETSKSAKLQPHLNKKEIIVQYVAPEKMHVRISDIISHIFFIMRQSKVRDRGSEEALEKASTLTLEFTIPGLARF